ncbi:PAS domain-containing protein [Nitriliruptoraceae bacterium ZYF776]|nr:PAS domain-containing protein [Profundirhabdus halotolerans]
MGTETAPGREPSGEVARALFERTDELVVVVAFARPDPAPEEVFLEDVNPAFAERFGRTPDALRGAPLLEVYPREETVDVVARCQAARRNGGRYRYTTVRDLGDSHRVATANIAVLGGDRFLVWGRIEHRLDDAQARLADLEALADIGSFSWDLTSGELTLSPQYRRILEVGDDAPATMDLVFGRVHPDDRAALAEQVAATERDGTTATSSFRVQTPSGEVRRVEGRAEIVHDLLGRAVRVVGTIQDVTLRHRAAGHEVALETVAREREQALELNDDVVQGLSQAWLALQLGELDEAGAAVRRATLAAHDIVAGLLRTTSDTHGEVAAGQLARQRPSGDAGGSA